MACRDLIGFGWRNLAAAARVEPASDAGLVRTVLEMDGRRVVLDLPTELLHGMQALGGGSVESSVAADASPALAAAVHSPISGTLLSWRVADGDAVQEGEVIAVMEAMKMQMQVAAHRAGRITLQAVTGSYQTADAVLACIE